jgi:hypothetical protein
MDTHTTRTVAAVALAATVLSGCQLPAGLAGTDTTPAVLADLTIAPEDTGAHYDRDDWPHWTSIGDGCDTRDLVLRAEGQDVREGKGCTTSGTWVSAYDGVTVIDPGDLDIDHLVPLAEAARSGSREWTEAQREAYANDPDGLIAVTATSNRQKGDQDPATWLPERDRCGYVGRWIAVKREYRLTADRAEADALAAVLARC